MDLDSAISKHAEWKLKFRNAIAGKTTMDAATITKDNCCDLGKWLHGEGKAQYGKMTSFSNCLQKHAAFHVEAGKVAQAINHEKYKEAEAMISGSTPYAEASSAVGTAIIGLKKEAKL